MNLQELKNDLRQLAIMLGTLDARVIPTEDLAKVQQEIAASRAATGSDK